MTVESSRESLVLASMELHGESREEAELNVDHYLGLRHGHGGEATIGYWKSRAARETSQQQKQSE